MVSYLRPLFKVGYNALRSQYGKGTPRVFENFNESAREVFKNPYIKNYLDAASNKQGIVRTAAATSLPFMAYDEITELLPERVQESTKIEASNRTKDGPVDMPPNVIKKPKIINTTEVKKEDANKELNNLETDFNNQFDGTGTNTASTNRATVDATNSEGTDTIESDAVTRVKAYKDIVRQFIGSGDQSARMQKQALLMNVGGMLMAGKSKDPGLAGFTEIIGQTAMATAPMLFQMGVEQGKADREIGQAALQLYMEDLNDQDDRSGDFTAVWQNEYERDNNGEIIFDPYTGVPKVSGKKLISQFRANSDEMNWFLDQNNELGFPRYTFQPSSATGPGLFGLTGSQSGGAVLMSDAAKDSMIKFADYTRRGLIPMAQMIMPMMIENRDSLIGYKGFLGRNVGPTAFLASEAVKGLKAGFGENSITQLGDESFQVNRNSELGKFYNQILGSSPDGQAYDQVGEGMSFAVLEAPTDGAFVNIPGLGEMPVFVDTGGKYGVRGAQYLTRSNLEKVLFDPRKGQLEIFETTLGLMLARNRQPTGRMLADVLRRSFEETSMTSLMGKSNMPEYVIGKYVSIYNELYTNMSQALNLAGYVSSEAEKTNASQIVSPGAFEIPGIENFYNSYYNLRANDPAYSVAGYNIEGVNVPQYPDWNGGNGAVVYQDNLETNQNTESVFDKWNNIFDE
tara:strand:- start:870 stop:2921 length:2052 start_codon:yes stop_codon:yes gene_type:complete